MFFFFFNETATTEIYTLSLHDALPIYSAEPGRTGQLVPDLATDLGTTPDGGLSWTFTLREGVRFETGDRKSTRLNSSHANISYAVFCLKKKKKKVTL